MRYPINRRVALGSLFTALTVGAWGCSKPMPEDRTAQQAQATEPPQVEAAPAQQAEEPSSADEPDRGRRGNRGDHRGPAKLIRSALRELELSEEQQRSLEAMLEEMEGDKAELGERGQMREALAKAAEDGEVTVAEMRSQIDAVASHVEERARAMQSLLDRLHATLDSSQRQELVAAIEDRMGRGKGHRRGGKGKRKGRGKGPGGKGPHGKGGRGKGPHGRLEFLNLSEDQEQRIEQAFESAGLDRPDPEDRRARRQEHEARRRTMLKAFASDAFKAADHIDPEKMGKLARGKVEEHVKRIGLILPILDEAQRDQLIEHLERGPERRGWQKGSRGGRPGYGRGPRGEGPPGAGPGGEGPPGRGPRGEGPPGRGGSPGEPPEAGPERRGGGS